MCPSKAYTFLGLSRSPSPELPFLAAQRSWVELVRFTSHWIHNRSSSAAFAKGMTVRLSVRPLGEGLNLRGGGILYQMLI